MVKYNTPYFQALFLRHAAAGGRYAKQELTWKVYVAFRRRYNGRRGLRVDIPN